MKLNEEFAYQILSTVEEIPKGCVATYGQIARLSGHDNNARMVGKILSTSKFFGNYPCHRVVNGNGRCAPQWNEQRGILINEGVQFKANGCVDLKKYQWNE